MGDVLPVGSFVEFELPHPPGSKKNGRVWRKRYGKLLLCPSDRAHNDAAMIAAAAKEAAHGLSFGPNDQLRIDYWHVLDSDTVGVRVTKIGEMPAKGKRGTKRDLHGMLETLADAMQGVLYEDDRNVDEVSCARRRA